MNRLHFGPLLVVLAIMATSVLAQEGVTTSPDSAARLTGAVTLPAPSAEVERIEGLLSRSGGLDRLAEPLASRFASSVLEVRAERPSRWRRSSRRDGSIGFATVVRSDSTSSLLLMKASELEADGQENVRLRVDREEEVDLPFEIVGTDAATDLALLRVATGGLTPIEFDAQRRDADVGAFAVSVGPDGEVAALSVIGVGARTISGGGGFLGVTIEDAPDASGAEVVAVEAGSAAAKAGIVIGDIITSIESRSVTDRRTLISGVSAFPPKSRIAVGVRRESVAKVLEAVLGARGGTSRLGAYYRRDANMMGGQQPSVRRGGFTSAVQHDARLRASECGGPILDLEGKALGLNIARAGRTKSLFLPASEVRRAMTRLAPSSQEAPTKTAAKKSDLTGRLEEKDGTQILYLWGTPTERGYAEGKLMGDVIFATLEEFALSRNIVPQPMIWDTVIRPMVERSFAFDSDFEAWAKGMLKGITEARKGNIKLSKLGRDLQVGDLKVVSCIPDLAGFMCSSFAAWGNATETGSTIVGRNLDYYGTPTMTKNSLIKVNAATAKRAAWVGIGWAGVAGCLTGYSENGTWIAIHDVYMKAKPADKRFTSRMFALEEILTTTKPDGKPVDAALAILRDRRFSLGCNAMYAWDGGPKARGASVLEFDIDYDANSGATARLPEKGQPFIACSNHHRVRSEKGHDCWRYGKLFDGAKAIQPDAKLNVDRGWRLIKQSSVSMTIYRVVADLGTGDIQVERRLEPGKNSWSKRLKINAKTLLAEVKSR